MKKILLIIALLAGYAQAQTTTTITGTLKDLSQAVVTSGKVTFTLTPSRDTTISGIARFTPTTVTCLINASGLIKAQDGVSVCTLTMNTALQPGGSWYTVAVWPYFVKTSSFSFYAVLATYDWSTVVPTPTTTPAQNFVDTFSSQTIGGNKTFTGNLTLSGTALFSANNTFSGNNIFTGSNTHSGLETFSGGFATPAHSGNSYFGNLNGAINPQDYGAKCDGTTDDTAAFQSAITAAFPNNGGSSLSIVVPATGNGCVITQLNLTNINNEILIQGQSSINGFQSILWCRENTSNTKVCLDFTGSQYISLEHLDLYGGTSTADTPRVTVLLAKSNTGNSQIIHWNDVTVEGYGDYQVYNYGGEVWKCEYCSFYQHGAAGVDLVRLTSTNSVGIASPFSTIGVGNESMTKVNLWGTWSAGGTADGIAIESSSLPISQITIGGFGNLTSASSFIRDLGAGEIHGLSLADLRVEPTCTNCKLLTISNNISNLKIDAQWAAPSAPSVTLVNLSGQINNADITLRPGDGQALFPSVAVITCSGTVLGTIIHDFVKTGGGAQTNACPGAIEIFGSIGLPVFQQVAAKAFASSCAMAAGTTCTIAGVTSTYNSTPLCFTTIDAASTVPATAISSKCSLSGSTITITAGASNSLTWDAALVGNPN